MPAAFADCAPVARAPGQKSPNLAQFFSRAAQRPNISLAQDQPAQKESVELTYIGHSTFVIRSPEGVTAATDYNDYVRPAFVPDVVTMNNAHSTHFTDHPDSGIKHVLRGWHTGSWAKHNVKVRDMYIRNVPTNVRDLDGTRYAGNSIFVFETAKICIAHLGHLHHDLTPEHLGQLGQIDVLLVPVDGAYTLAQELMSGVIDQIRPHVVIPMHVFSSFTLERFLKQLEGRYTVKRNDGPTVRFSRATLPEKQVLVLHGF
ncbi:MAG: MBL fold metallo-hydrolase [Alphaproteobacteria bacterium]